MTETDALQALRLAWPDSQIDVTTLVFRSMAENSTEVVIRTRFQVCIDCAEHIKEGDHLQAIVRELVELARLEKYRANILTPKEGRNYDNATEKARQRDGSHPHCDALPLEKYKQENKCTTQKTT